MLDFYCMGVKIDAIEDGGVIMLLLNFYFKCDCVIAQYEDGRRSIGDSFCCPEHSEFWEE